MYIAFASNLGGGQQIHRFIVYRTGPCFIYVHVMDVILECITFTQKIIWSNTMVTDHVKRITVMGNLKSKSVIVAKYKRRIRHWHSNNTTFSRKWRKGESWNEESDESHCDHKAFSVCYPQASIFPELFSSTMTPSNTQCTNQFCRRALQCVTIIHINLSSFHVFYKKLYQIYGLAQQAYQPVAESETWNSLRAHTLQ